MQTENLRFNTQCVLCILNRYLDKAPKGTDEATKLLYAKKILKLIAEADNDITAPEIVAAATEIKNGMFGFCDDYAEIKRHFNSLMLSKEKDFKNAVENSEKPLLTALKFALLGNYIDFGAMNSVDEKRLDNVIEDAENTEIDKKELGNFIADLENKKRLLYITDNCGEVVADKLLIGEIKRLYPKLGIEVLVRGEPVLNDATMEDAKQVGLTDIVKVTPNGTNIAGTALKRLPPEIRKKVDSADIIISKGQGNFETLNGCGKNIYYLFLCKCSLFAERFGVKKLTGMFLNDLRM